MKKIISFLLILTVLTTCFSTWVFAKNDSDFDLMMQRIEDSLIESPSQFSLYRDDFPDLLGEDGKFSDLDYNEKLPKFDHIKRICCMAWHYYLPHGKLYKNAEVSPKILAGLTYYVEQKYPNGTVGVSDNWSNTLEAPQYIIEAMVALEKAGITVPQKLLDICVEHYFDMHQRDEDNARKFAYNTSNIAYTCNLWKRLAYILKDEKYLKWIYEESTTSWMNHANGEYGVIYGDDGDRGGRLGVSFFGDGYYPDGSYFGHGPFPYTLGYGNQFLANNVGLVKLAAGTKYQASEEQLSVLVDLLLEGMRWLTRGDNAEFITEGRDINGSEAKDGGNTNGKRTRFINYATNLLAEPNIPRRAELESFVAKLKENKDESYVEGNKHFWLTDQMAHHRENYFAAVRFPSIRTLKSERVGNKGTLSYFVSDGSLQFYVTGKEYFDAFTVWDWERIPGITNINTAGDPPEMTNLSNIPNEHYGSSEFCGGVSDGTYGAATMNLATDVGVDVKKSWFFFDDEVVALGTDIKCIKPSEVYTNINQCTLNGEVAYGKGDEEQTLSENSKVSAGDANWVYHSQIGYIIPEEGQNVYFSNEAQTGNGSRKDEPVLRENVTRDIFSMYINHGSGVKDGKYSYIVVPGASKETVKEYAKDIPVQILKNDKKIQAVYHKKLNILQAVFREEGEITLENGLKIAVDTPCVVMVKPINGGYAVSVQNPENKKVQIGFKINQKFETDAVVWNEKTGMSEMNILNRNGIFSGETVTVNLTTSLISNVSYNKEADRIDFDGIIPAKSARYIYAKITDKNGKTYLKASEIKKDSTYDFSYPASELPAGKYSVEMYCENDMESIFDEVVIEKEMPDAPVIFRDTVNHWCRDYAARMALYGIIKGDGNGCFRPDDNISLAELLKIIIASAESCKMEMEPFEQGSDTWDEATMKYAVRNELLPDAITELNASDFVNRQEMITILINSAEKYGWLNNYKNNSAIGEIPADLVSVNYWAYSAVEKAFSLGIVEGDGSGIKPFDYSTRSECVKIIEKLIAELKRN
ncbi:MAG: S-layer homology domain-containing protein [Clostridia bacterium]|nr:S-layer homology domain-containing protein [Clostridia bacterium]